MILMSLQKDLTQDEILKDLVNNQKFDEQLNVLKKIFRSII